MGMFDWLVGKKSEEWYRSELEPLLREYQQMNKIYVMSEARGYKSYGGISPRNAKNRRDGLTRQITGLTLEMKRYGYKNDDLLKKYDAEHFR